MYILKIERRIGKDEFWDAFNQWLIECPRKVKKKVKRPFKERRKNPLSKEEIKKRSQLYYEKHKEQIKERSRLQHEQNREQRLIQMSEYMKTKRKK